MKLALVLVSLFAQCILATVLVPPEWQSIDAPVNPDLQVRVVFSLHQDNLDELERLFWERSDPTNEKYAQYFTQQELGEIVAPGGHRESNVIRWMKANNLTDAQIETVNTRDVVYLHGSVQQIARLLKVKFEYFQHVEVKERTILRSLTKAFIPFHLRSDIQLIHGINDFPPLFRRAKNRQTGNVEMPQHKIKSGESSAACEFAITSVNARSQTAGATIIINLSYNCSATPCTSFTVAAASANPNINYNISMTFPAVQVCTNNVCAIPLTVAYYIPLNVSATAYCGSNIGPVQYTYPVLVDPHVVPQTLWSLYNMGKNPIVTHPNATQAVVEFEQQYYSPNDLTEFFVLMGLPLTAPVTVIGPNDVTNPGAEANLDIQWIMAMAPGAPTFFWSILANSTIEIDHILTWCYQIGNYTNPPLVNSLSYGMTEGNVDKYLGAGYLNRTNTELQKLALQGLTIIIADGDAGANDIGAPPMSQLKCDPSHPDWPSDSMYVTAVSSTFITPLSQKICYVPNGADCTQNALGEVTVSVDMGMTWTSGGGFSNVTARPPYQDDAVNAYLTGKDHIMPPSSYFNANGRAYGDVATVGHNLEVVLSKTLVAIDGTSASAPIFAGIVTILNNARLLQNKAPLGFINPLIYQTAAAIPYAWNDVTVGHNRCATYGWAPICCPNGYYAAQGWDPVSGVGSPNVARLINYVLSLP